MNQLEEALRNAGFKPSKKLVMERKAQYLARKASKEAIKDNGRTKK